MKNLYLECLSGVSGDMLVGSLLDLGADEKKLRQVLSQLNENEFKITIERKEVFSIDTCSFDVLYGHRLNSKTDDSISCPEHAHNHEEEHEHIHNHGHRNLSDIFAIIDKLIVEDSVKNFAKEAFHIVAVAESQAHGLPIYKVHFHEVGAIDSIVDIISFSVLFNSLNIDNVYVSDIHEGTGTVLCQHGLLPVPVPAVINITSAYHLPLVITKLEGEMVTPTGAALIATLKPKFEAPSLKGLQKIGLGSGKSYSDRANYVRAMLIEKEEDAIDNTVLKIETNIDDSTGEEFGYTMGILFEQGALDVYYTPIFMKKNRPAYMLSVICLREDKEKMEKVIFENTSTIGLRYCTMERSILKREAVMVKTQYGEVSCKKSFYKNLSQTEPEFESVKELSMKNHVNYKTIYNEAISQIKEEN